MKTRQRTILAAIVLTPLLTATLAIPCRAATARERIAGLGKAIDTRVLDWELSLDGSRWEPLQPGRTVKAAAFRLRATVRAAEFFAGARVAGAPLRLHARLQGRGLVLANFLLDGRELEQATLHGESGTAVEETRDVLLMEKADQAPHVLEIAVENRGFVPARGESWPERRRGAPAEEGSWFNLQSAELVYANAEKNLAALKEWLDSFQFADILVNPELKRYTFTGKPYDIPDKRRVDAARLARINAALDRAAAALDLGALAAGDWPRARASLRRSLRLAAPVRSYLKEFRIHLVGNAHIDIAWLWRMAETMALAKNTYETVIQNMGEYPELTYAQSQAVTYDWIEKKHPDLFKAIKEKVQAGRWEIVGGMWVEPDCNLIAGESWARQILYGKKYFHEKFGVDVRIGWNPDSFGYNWNMPQLYKLGGIDSFITQKLWWNDTTVFPHFLFNWQGVDGTTILTYMPPLSYASRLQLQEVANGVSKYEATTGLKESLILYGLGDHGGGPNREILDRVRGYGKLSLAPRFVHTTPSPFLQKKRSEKLDLPLWQDELYLEYHQGTFTTQGAIKKNNRRTEALLATTEKLASIAWLLDGSYPGNELEQCWKSALTLQFHDILPGSSITPVIRDALETYKKVRRELMFLQENALARIAAGIDTSWVKGTPLLVFNPLSWERDDAVTVVVQLPPGGARLFDDQGREIPHAHSGGEFVAGGTRRPAEFTFVARNVPALGYRIYDLIAEPAVAGAGRVSGGEIVPGTGRPAAPAFDPVLENAALRVVIDRESGNIRSLFDKRQGREFVAAGEQANKLWVYEDRPEDWDAWNIGYTGRGWELNRADRVQLVEDGPLRTVVRIDKSFLGLTKSREYPSEDFPSSFFTQHVTLYKELDRVDIRTEADWWEDHLSLKACFPVDVEAEKAYYEIPFAAIGRTTRSETLWEKARYEVPALRWADLADEKGGLALLNDGKYGHDIHGGVMKLSLLRSPTWPDPTADRGRHEFTYSLYPHAGSWSKGQVVRRGQELNQPLVARVLDPHQGPLPAVHSFFAIGGNGVILDAVKLAEEGRGLVLRIYEANGNAERAVLRFHRPPQTAVLADLLEKETAPLPLKEGRLELDFRPFEIKTVRIEFAGGSNAPAGGALVPGTAQRPE